MTDAPRRLGSRRRPSAWSWLLAAALAAVAAAAPARGDGPDMPIGLVAERPPSGRFVQTERGWMVPYSMTIPGTEVAFEMVPIPGGDFRMGSPAGEKGRDDDEGPQFTVRVEPFWMGKHEVTWAEYRCYMETLDLLIHLAARGVRPQAKLDAVDAVTTPSAVFNTQFIYGNGEDPRLPAATMTQFAVRQYTKWLSGLTASFHRLPNEAEWEYACRAGTTSAWHFGDDPRQLGDYAWYEGSSDDTTHRVGLKKSNLWGIHDMHGNVAEWVLDQYDPRGYARAEGKTIPADAAILWPTKLGPRVLRGGCYESQANECRSAARFPSADDEWQTRDANFPHSPWWYNDEAALTVGFRIVRPLTEPPAKERVRFWDADTDSIRQAVKARQPFTAIGVADPKLAEEFKKHREQ